MRRFAALYLALDSTTSTLDKVAAMREYFRAVDARDGAWAVYLLIGRKLKRLIGGRKLYRWASEEAGLPEWLLDESYSVVGDLAETLSLLFSSEDAKSSEKSLANWIEHELLPLRDQDDEVARAAMVRWWKELPRGEVFVLTKLLTGELRVGVSQTLVERAVAEVAGVESAAVAHGLMGDWKPTPAFFRGLLSADGASANISRPYPFYLASPLAVPKEARAEGFLEEMLGERSKWFAEWKWDGFRAQLIRRQGQVFMWSRGDENVTDRLPEIVQAGLRLAPEASTLVLDGEVLAWEKGKPLPFARLQKRIGRTNLSVGAIRESPIAFVVYDLLEMDGVDLRAVPLEQRRAMLSALGIGTEGRVLISPLVEGKSWEELELLWRGSRERGVEGLMLKKMESPYRAGRIKGDATGEWWKWKIDPYVLDCVLMYAQPGHGKRANLLTDYTFGVWDGKELVPLAKAYSGLDNVEIEELDKWIRQHSSERFGTVRAVKVEKVFEIAFEGIAASGRHRGGIALRFPRISRWRRDKKAEEANTIEDARKVLGGPEREKTLFDFEG